MRPAWVLLCCMAAWSAAGLASDDVLGLRMTASATTVKQGETFRVDVVLTVRGQDAVDEFESPDLTDFELTGQSESSNASFSMNGGRRSVIVEHRRAYLVRADDVGVKQVGEAVARLGGNTARAAPISIRVVGSANSTNARGDDKGNDRQGDRGNESADNDSVDGARADDARLLSGALAHDPAARFAGRSLPELFVDVRLDKDTAVVGQQIGVVTEVWSLTPLAQYPRVRGQKPAGFVCVTVDDGVPLEASQRTLRGRGWFVYPVARDALFALAPGRKVLPAVDIDVLPTASLFRRAAEVRVQSEPVTVDVLALPEPAPEGFSPGNVGLWDVRVSVRPERVAVGEPFSLVVEVAGVGNVDAVEPPTWSGAPGLRLFPPTVRRERTDKEGVVAGRVIAETLVQAQDVGVVRIPSLSLVTFVPEEGRYVVRSALPAQVTVVTGASTASVKPSPGPSGASARVDVGQGSRPLALDIEPRASRVDDDRIVWVGLVFGASGALAAALGALARRKAESQEGRAARRRALRSVALEAARERMDLAQAQQCLFDALADRCGEEVRAVEIGLWDTFLPTRGLPASLSSRAVTAARAAEAARYAPGGTQEAAFRSVYAACRALDDSAVVERAVVDSAVAERAVVGSAVVGSAVAESAVADRAVADRAVADRAVADRAVADRAVADRAGADGQEAGR
jgi:hypothetical protein